MLYQKLSRQLGQLDNLQSARQRLLAKAQGLRYALNQAGWKVSNDDWTPHFKAKSNIKKWRKTKIPSLITRRVHETLRLKLSKLKLALVTQKKMLGKFRALLAKACSRNALLQFLVGSRQKLQRFSANPQKLRHWLHKHFYFDQSIFQVCQTLRVKSAKKQTLSKFRVASSTKTKHVKKTMSKKKADFRRQAPSKHRAFQSRLQKARVYRTRLFYHQRGIFAVN